MHQPQRAAEPARRQLTLEVLKVPVHQRLHVGVRAGRDRARVFRKMGDGTLEPVGRPSELGRLQPLVTELDELALALRRAPVRVAVGEVEVADVSARGAGARKDEVDRRPHRTGLVEPRGGGAK
jgi:hypothetical protein